MSKNVAVFVDVANIFYAAKAAGVDIDYVTLLKSATAGRDFVRAYAYTGLDPENENQRQFHAFLGRSGYKVISKDIRKYGDGRVKANLDIELVVDMMKTARNLDIAVIVSGDGDFAPAIRAVQEMGVRCEVISFRGNTSSDLIEAADVFTDIAQVARVEKGSVRSGRRVAAEGDLSMTEVPEKETEGAPRRRRTSRVRDEKAAVAATPAVAAAAADGDAHAGALVALPGERLSRAGDGDEPVEIEAEEVVAESGSEPDALGEDGRRRRRRRGGRGRGRGRRPEDEALPVEEGAPEAGAPMAAAALSAEDDEEFDEPQPAQLPHHTFGSVWDSQIGLPSAALPPAVNLAGDVDDEDLDEPEVPEYLIAERRQRTQHGASRGGRAGGGRNRGAYQVALDRERFGRGAPQPSFGGASRPPERSRDRGRPSRPASNRPVERAPRMPERAPRMPERQAPEIRTSSEPWSEVPPELEQMLRAELARKQPAPSSGAPAVEMTSAEPAPMTAETAAPETAKPVRRRRTTKSAPAEQAQADVATEAVAPVAEAPAKPVRRTTRTVKAKPETAAAVGTEAEPAAVEAAKKPVRRTRTTKSTPAEG